MGVLQGGPQNFSTRTIRKFWALRQHGQRIRRTSNGKHQLLLEGKATLKDIRELPDFFHFKEFLSKVEENSFAREGRTYKVVLRITDMSQLDLTKLDIAQNAFGGRKIVVQNAHSRHEYLEITDAIDYLRNDFRIYLENNTTDGDFVKEVYQLITGKQLRDDFLHTCGRCWGSP